jgi:F-type H+-transporting ATPase subunit b
MLEINPGLTIWTFIVFGVLLFLLTKMGWKPMLASLRNREQAIADSLSKAEHARTEAEKLIAETERQRKLNEDEIHKQLREGKEYVERMRHEMMTKAQEESHRLVVQARAEIERDKKTAIEELRAEAADLAVLAAGKLLDEMMTDEKHKQVVRKFIAELPQQTN